MDKNMKVLIVVGAAGVGIYILYKGGYLAQWFPQLFPATSPTTTTPPVTSPGAPPISTQPPAQAPFQTTPPQYRAPVIPTVPIQTIGNPPRPGPTPTPAPTPPPAAIAQAISQQMLALATAAGYADGNLNMDQWCWFYTQASGNQCPVDPGSIDPGVYQGAGVVNPDGSAGDRTTPTFLSTWLAIMQLEAPSAGLTGIGDLQYLALRNNAWLT